jgi:erythromycin esterase-like protein
MASQAVRLSTPEARHGFEDMQPLKKIIGDARIVSLGEATHGTREFFQMKHRMMEFLASEMGFTIFSIEANMPEAYKVNDYVLTGRGDPAKLLKGMYFWTWDTEEVLDMIRWMREFNQSGKGHVEFTGFDMQTPTVASEIVRDFVAKNDPEFVDTLRTASEAAETTWRRQGGMPAGGGFGVATAKFPVEAARGKRIRYTGYIKTKDVEEGFAGLWWRVDGPKGVLAFDNMQSRGVRGTTDWKQYSIELPVDADAVNINFGALLPGNGTAWFDDLRVEVDGKPYADDNLDLGFETFPPKGFYTGGNGYRVERDNEVLHGGEHSLRMMRVAPMTPPGEKPDPQAAAAKWSGILEHLESSRKSYLEKKADEHDIDWAIQNARVVLQCMQGLSNQTPRDVSMAANVKWIADHSPKAKIVLWAHNGHVSTRSMAGFKPMGSELRRMFGNQMYAFGFAFYAGDFQAMTQGKGGLKNFTVPPAPPGSLDAALASTKLPLFALDLRQAPKSGPVADWLAKEHKTRSIGAVYPEDSPFAFMADLKALETFDGILFVEKTTAARKNPGR